MHNQGENLREAYANVWTMPSKLDGLRSSTFTATCWAIE
jgi:hypothetical protein